MMTSKLLNMFHTINTGLIIPYPAQALSLRFTEALFTLQLFVTHAAVMVQIIGDRLRAGVMQIWVLQGAGGPGG